MKTVKQFLIENDYCIKIQKNHDSWRVWIPGKPGFEAREVSYYYRDGGITVVDSTQDEPLVLSLDKFALKPLMTFDTFIWAEQLKFPLEQVAYYDEDGNEVENFKAFTKDESPEFYEKENSLINLLSATAAGGHEIDDFIEAAENLDVLDEFMQIVLKYAEEENE